MFCSSSRSSESDARRVSRPDGSSRRRPRSRRQFRANRAAAHAFYRHAVRRHRLLRACHIPPPSAFAPGSVFSAQVNYREGVGAKVRPVIVIDASSSEVLVVPCTTKRTADVLRLVDPVAAGLQRETWLRPRPVKLVRNAFIERLGRVTVEDFKRASRQARRDGCPASASVPADHLLGELREDRARGRHRRQQADLP